jgi:hypothetical protein
VGPQSRTLQPVRGEGYEPAHKSRANAETHPRLGVGGCGVSGGWWKTLHWEGEPQYERPTTSTTVSQSITPIKNNGGHLFLPFVTSLRGKLNTLTVIPYSRTPYSDQTNKLSKPMVPARQMGPPTRQSTAEFDPEPASTVGGP